MSERVLSQRELNRATLARQLLLERPRLEVVDAVERLVALQAQEPASPYVALATRLDGFNARQLDRALHERRVVKGTLMRATLHLVSGRDYRCFWPALQPAIRKWRDASLRQYRLTIPLEEIGAQALEFTQQPRTNQELIAHLPRMGGDQRGPAGQDHVWWALRVYFPFLMAPSDVAWSFGRRPTYVSAEAWLGQRLSDETSGLEHLVRRYLAGFGPASVADMQQFTKIDRGPLKAAIERLGSELVRYADERGRALYDLPGAPIPAADVPAPPRLLAMWDSPLLAYADRTRLMPEAYRKRVVMTNGDYLPTFLVDGRVAGLWRAEVADGKVRIHCIPFDSMPREVEVVLEREAERMAAFVEPYEPNVYGRYAHWMRKCVAGSGPVGGTKNVL